MPADIAVAIAVLVREAIISGVAQNGHLQIMACSPDDVAFMACIHVN